MSQSLSEQIEVRLVFIGGHKVTVTMAKETYEVLRQYIAGREDDVLKDPIEYVDDLVRYTLNPDMVVAVGVPEEDF